MRKSGQNHIDVAACYDNLATVYARLGDLDKAEVCSKTALKIRRDNLNDDHVDVAVPYKNVMAVDHSEDRLSSNKADVAASNCNIGM
jgi:Tfp pilus assembly protein PilF